MESYNPNVPAVLDGETFNPIGGPLPAKKRCAKWPMRPANANALAAVTCVLNAHREKLRWLDNSAYVLDRKLRWHHGGY